MRNKIPEEIIDEIASIGGLKGISKRLPSLKKIQMVANRYEILSDPVRLQILLALGNERLCVCILKKITACPDTRLSYHLSMLKQHQLISSKREKSFLKYYLTVKGKVIVSEILRDVYL